MTATTSNATDTNGYVIDPKQYVAVVRAAGGYELQVPVVGQGPTRLVTPKGQFIVDEETSGRLTIGFLSNVHPAVPSDVNKDSGPMAIRWQQKPGFLLLERGDQAGYVTDNGDLKGLAVQLEAKRAVQGVGPALSEGEEPPAASAASEAQPTGTRENRTPIRLATVDEHGGTVPGQKRREVSTVRMD